MARTCILRAFSLQMSSRLSLGVTFVLFFFVFVFLHAFVPKALRSSRKRPIHSFSWPLTQPAPSTISPNITHFGSLVSSMRATNLANKIYGVGITDRAKGSLVINLLTLDWVETHKTSTPPKDLCFLDWVRTRQRRTQMGTQNQRVGITDRAKESLVPNLLTPGWVVLNLLLEPHICVCRFLNCTACRPGSSVRNLVTF